MPEKRPTLRVLLVSEGKHEQGGALLRLVERGCPGFAVEATQERLSDQRIKSSNGKGRGTLKRAIRWVQHAEARGFDACVLLLDEDGEAGRIGEMDDAQASDLAGLPRALGVAVRSFDAWMLADEVTLTAALGRAVQRQKDPEPMADPKAVFAGLLAGTGLGQAEAYAAVAGLADAERIAERCPRGFAPFARRLRSLLPPGG